ncbi:hypothetical protein ASPZODRAFT_149262 [Penicilliopsis zonata CBS 506.65]|uniref:Amidohydrolase-related domain-containing protein n=1 Tax=Penicilliopsis zonata CBS 506.65 TaxID=1073090 RepID=A0A1L9SRP6_9EURO|nr:hypothetical protein ASPZODRAFT_149262 [Penicilliopsis zonata CBS 506.65]OJJ49787.1 hypothetical protein ASPZODRAFT_149262 [Penicilliopsis zonata CBS 506.65]
MSQSILLKNGMLLLHKPGDVVSPVKADPLIVQDRINKVGEVLDAPYEDTKVVDCSKKIISPGFLKGRHSDDPLLDYLPTENMQGYFYDLEDVYWGQLDVGITYVVDHAYMNYPPESGINGISATKSPGIRAFFCYCATSRFMSRSPLKKDDEIFLLELDWFSMPKQVVVDLFNKARRWGVKNITAHYTKGPYSAKQILESYGLLGADLLSSHSNAADHDDALLLKRHNAYILCTPKIEMQMAIGEPLAFHEDFSSICSLGIDCHSNNSSDMMTQMRLALQSARARFSQPFLDQGIIPRKLKALVQGVFSLGTIQENEIGSIATGKLADLVIFKTTSPSMVFAAQGNPLTAIAMYPSVRDFDMVIVNGKIRKENEFWFHVGRMQSATHSQGNRR